MAGALSRRRIHSNLRVFLACAFFAGILCSLIAPVLAAGGQVGIIQGTVTDANGNPIGNAAVSAVSPSASYNAATAPNGTFTIVGVDVDTYVISVSAPEYDTYVLPSASVIGDQTLTLPLKLTRRQDIIGKINARSASGAFQPLQTVESYTISGARIAQTTGNPADTSLNDVVLAAPGVSLSENGLPSIRGGSQREVGYQLDGVTFTEPVLGQNGSTGLFNGIGSVQVVEGGGDASQGGLGAGVINVIAKRGTYPAAGDVVLQVGGPNFNNFVGGEYGFATRDGAISNYVSMEDQRYAPYYGFPQQNAAAYGNYFGVSLRHNTQFADNFVFKFGPNKNQSLQVLYENVSRIDFGNLGGLPPGTYPSDPFALPAYPFDNVAYAGFGGPPPGLAYVQPAPNTPSSNVHINTPEINNQYQTRFLKLEYDNSLDAKTYLAVRYYNWEELQTQQFLSSLGPVQQGAAFWLEEGGPTVGTSFDLTHVFGDKLTVTLNGQYSVLHPVINYEIPTLTPFFTPIGDFMPPAAGCPAAYGAGTVSCAYGAGTVLEPEIGLNFNNSYFQNYGLGLRFQYAISQKLHADFGARYEGQNQHWNNPYNPDNVINPLDVLPQLWTAAVTNPTVWSPRVALSYQIDADDAVRASYGRSAVFMNAQTAGTPTGLYGNLAALAALPPNLNGVAPIVPGAPLANQCGTLVNGVAGTFPCANYLQQFYWAADRAVDPAGDGGGPMPAIYSNYDASYSHQFGPNGVAVKVTPFYKFGTNLPSSTFFGNLPGGTQIFTESSKAFNRTTGVEFNVTTPDRPVGFSGFISAAYQNVLQSAPPLSNGEYNGIPQLSPATLALGDVYRAGYVAPAAVRIGGTYSFRNGISITPIVQISSGFPYNAGNLIASGGPGSTCPAQPLENYPQVNFGCGVPILLGYQNAGGTSLNTNYYDPAYSGSYLSPNIAATRGTPASSSSGGITWSPDVQLNVTLQYKHNRDTVGIQLIDVGTNGYNNTTPTVNPFYQPVANGLSGPQTGQNTCIAQYGSARGCSALPANTYAFSNGAYLLTNGNVGLWQLAPLAPMSVDVYYRRQF
jgi:hypothetical protein